MATNYPTDDDEPSDRQRLAATERDSVADVEPPDNYLDEFPRWCGVVDVAIRSFHNGCLARRFHSRTKPSSLTSMVRSEFLGFILLTH